jgi:hypothetical protein
MRKIAGVLLSSLILLLILTTVALGASKPVELQITEEIKNCVFTIEWENTQQKAQVEIVSPTGEKFGTELTPERTTVMEGAIYINVGTAPAGTWVVNITAEKLGKVDIWASELPGSMNIDAFKVEKQSDGSYKATWSVSDCPENIQAEIYADRDRSGYDGVLVARTGSNSSGETTFWLNNLENGPYYFCIKVFLYQGPFSYAYAKEAVIYEDPYSPEKLQNVQAGLLNEDVYISWEGNARQYKVMLYAADTMELLAEDITQENSILLAFPKDVSEVLAGVASYDYERLGKFDLYKISNTNPLVAEVVYPSESVTNQSSIFADVTFSGDYNVSATLNDVIMLDNGDGPGKYRINLEEGDNTIVFVISDNKGNMRTYLKEIYMDSTPPQLAVYKDVNKSRTGDSTILLEGYTEEGAALYCNNQPVELVNNYFSITVNLSLGKNQITLSAKDIAGNESLYTAEVTRILFTGSILRWIILGLVGLALVILETVVLVKGVKRRKNESA